VGGHRNRNLSCWQIGVAGSAAAAGSREERKEGTIWFHFWAAVEAKGERTITSRSASDRVGQNHCKICPSNFMLGNIKGIKHRQFSGAMFRKAQLVIAVLQ
jgi:hypothetical protein